MSSNYRTVGRDELRAVLQDENFATPAAGNESFELGVELFPICWMGGAPCPAPAEGEHGVRAIVARAAAEQGVALGPVGEPAGPGGGLQLGFGGQLGALATGLTPGAAAAALDRLLAPVERTLAEQGIELVALGHSPWHAPAQLDVRGPHAVEPWRSLDDIYGEAGALGGAMLRSAGTRVRVGFGGTVMRPLRWRAAELAAPLATAMFASSPLLAGGHDGFKSQRARARAVAGPTRTGWPAASATPGDVAGDPVEGYLDFALAARIAGVDQGDGAWIAPTRPLSFEQWMEHGVEGRYPDLDDWRRHLDTLEPEVVPAAGIEFRGIDSLPAPFRSVPLVLLAALLTEPGAAQAVVARLGPGAQRLSERWAVGARAGLLEPDLAADAAWAFGLAAEAILRLPEGWFPRPLLAAFVSYGRRFAQRGLTPADEVLDLFLERGCLGGTELGELEQRWSRATRRAAGQAA